MNRELLKQTLEWMGQHETAIFAASESAWKQMTLIAADIRAACGESSAAPDFAKIVRASDGQQVLFRKGENDDEKPCLFQMTYFDGFTAEMNITFNNEAAMEQAFEKAGQAQADAVRAAVMQLTEPHDQPALQEDCRSCGGSGDGGMGIGCTDCLGTGVV